MFNSVLPFQMTESIYFLKTFQKKINVNDYVMFKNEDPELQFYPLRTVFMVQALKR